MSSPDAQTGGVRKQARRCLGEAYLTNGDTELAIQNYEKSLSLDPANANAAAVLKKLKG
jgi:Tfp pilus assembly protein PilF